MLYKFKSRATADVIMLETNARQLLKIVGKEGEHGIITAAQIPAAIDALQAAVAADEAARQEPQDAPPQEGGGADESGQPSAAVRLHQRAAPFIDMLRRSAAEGHDVIW